MQSLEESVVKAMDGSDNELFAYLPYILQDIWEFGADPDAIVQLIEKHCTDYHKLKILDLGCGKGAVSVKTAKTSIVRVMVLMLFVSLSTLQSKKQPSGK